MTRFRPFVFRIYTNSPKSGHSIFYLVDGQEYQTVEHQQQDHGDKDEEDGVGQEDVIPAVARVHPKSRDNRLIHSKCRVLNHCLYVGTTVSY